MKIIVVDDEPIIADTLVNILQGEGHTAFAVSNGESAIKLVKLMHPVQPDVLVSDVIMPGMDGVETAKETLRLAPDCRVILFSGQAASTDLLAAAEARGYCFKILAKPVNPEILLAAIDRRERNVAGSAV
ncbi:MAG TPA: response regulator [Candidatus Angelobacter sp.]|nr:response regulator [Candidatus Angelobacter sp.]